MKKNVLYDPNDILKIQKDIEEKRLVFGQKFEKILLKKLNKIITFFGEIIQAKSCAFFGSFLIVATSILARSSRDVSYNYARFLAEKKISLLSAEILINFIGISLLIFLAILLRKKCERLIFNLAILSAAIAIFWPVFLLQFGGVAFLSDNSGAIFSKFFLLKNDFFWLVLFLFLCRDFFCKKIFLLPFLLFCTGAIFLLSSTNPSFEARSIFYSLSTPLIIFGSYFFIKQRKIDWKNDALLVLGIFLILQFDYQNFFETIPNLTAFWWLAVLFYALRDKEKRLLFWIGFLAIFLLSNSLFFIKEFAAIAWIFSFFLLLAALLFEQKICNKIEIPRLSAAFLATALSYFFALHLAAIFNLTGFAADKFKTPNQVSDQLIKTIKTYSNEEDFIVAFGDNFSEISLATFYTKRPLKTGLEDGSAKLVFVKKAVGKTKEKCTIDSLEKNFSNQNFAKNFTKNYRFLNQIISTEKREKAVEFFNENEEFKNLTNTDRIDAQIDVYVRR